MLAREAKTSLHSVESLPPLLVFSPPQNGGFRGVEETSIIRRSAQVVGEKLNSRRADGEGGTDIEEARGQGNRSSPASSTGAASLKET